MIFNLKIVLLVSIIVLSGCAEYRALVGSYGAEAADAQLEAAEWSECKLPSAGALERRYSLYSDPSNPKAKSWRGLCYGVGE